MDSENSNFKEQKGLEKNIREDKTMKVSLTNLEEIKPIITLALEAAGTRSAYPGFGNLYLRADKKNQTLLFRTTDGEVQVETHCECSCEEDGTAVVRVESFKKVFQKAEFSTLQLDASNNHMMLQTDFGKFKLRTYTEEDFPEKIELDKRVSFSLLTTNLVDAIRKTQYAVSTERTRYALNGVYIRQTGAENIDVVTTDGRRLALVVCPIEEVEGELKEGVILPIKFVRLMEKVCGLGSDSITLLLGSTSSGLQWDGGQVIARNIEGQFPDYTSVIPTDNDKVVVVSRAAFLQGIVEGSLLSEREARIVIIKLTQNQMSLSSQSYEGEEAEHILTVDYAGPDFKIAFNPDYLIDALRACNSEFVKLCLRDKESAALLLSEDEPHFKYVLMPLTVD